MLIHRYFFGQESAPHLVANVRAYVGDAELPTFQGEFNRSRYALILQGVYSTRIYLKQANDRVQTLLDSYAEPLSAWAWLLGTIRRAEKGDADSVPADTGGPVGQPQ